MYTYIYIYKTLKYIKRDIHTLIINNSYSMDTI